MIDILVKMGIDKEKAKELMRMYEWVEKEKEKYVREQVKRCIEKHKQNRGY